MIRRKSMYVRVIGDIFGLFLLLRVLYKIVKDHELDFILFDLDKK